MQIFTEHLYTQLIPQVAEAPPINSSTNLTKEVELLIKEGEELLSNERVKLQQKNMVVPGNDDLYIKKGNSSPIGTNNNSISPIRKLES